MKIFNIKKFSQGLTLIESIVYIVIFSILFAFVTNTLLAMSNAFIEVQRLRNLSINTSGALERIIREVRDANSIDLANSTFDTHPGELTVVGTDLAGDPKTVNFYLDVNERLYIDVNSSGGVLLSGEDIRFTNFVFRNLSTTTAEAIKLDLTVENTELNRSISTNFFTSVVLRGSYE